MAGAPPGEGLDGRIPMLAEGPMGSIVQVGWWEPNPGGSHVIETSNRLALNASPREDIWRDHNGVRKVSRRGARAVAAAAARARRARTFDVHCGTLLYE